MNANVDFHISCGDDKGQLLPYLFIIPAEKNALTLFYKLGQVFGFPPSPGPSKRNVASAAFKIDERIER